MSNTKGDNPKKKKRKWKYEEPRGIAEAEFVCSIPDDRITRISGFPPIIPWSDSDADHVDIIKDMKAEGYFDEW